ncbi:5'-methylthioadenosine/adenosylhomocysteine nucleosidase [Lactobacillaceae bacterium L1_55_11]|nr:5'-methylthioadenosine/adenosylhomocysteine nucleosidase [Lactobacillaceae bacterium L1_55_11]
MKVGIITPMAEEKGALVAALTDSKTSQIGDMEVITGQYHGHDIVLTESGIGKVAAAVAATVVIHQFQVEAVINTGSAGALQPELKIGDLVIGQQAAYSDVDVQVFGYDYGQLPGQPTYFEADPDLVATFEKLGSAQPGLIVSGDQFVQDQGRQQILTHFPKALVAEMEGAAVAQVATRFKVPFIILRGVSDLANGDSGVTFDEYVVTAGRASAQLLLQFLDQAPSGK